MKIYDTANQLANEIRNSDEYKNYKSLREYIVSKPELKEKIEQFEKNQYEIQLDFLQTGKQNEDRIKEMQVKYAELIKDEEVVKYFDAELKFNVLLADVNKIIGDVVKDIAKF